MRTSRFAIRVHWCVAMMCVCACNFSSSSMTFEKFKFLFAGGILTAQRDGEEIFLLLETSGESSTSAARRASPAPGNEDVTTTPPRCQANED
jgi:hypothetical protein